MSSVDRIFQIMEDRKLTSAFVSKQTGISAGNFTDWKKGRSKPGTKTINRLAEFFGVLIILAHDDPVAQRMFKTICNRASKSLINNLIP
ncbi:MAG: helix-turn-helix domain-containing protein [Christensenellales bacterium]